MHAKCIERCTSFRFSTPPTIATQMLSVACVAAVSFCRQKGRAKKRSWVEQKMGKSGEGEREEGGGEDKRNRL